MPHTTEFNKLFKSMKEEYSGKKVPRQYQNRYGKRYDISDIKSFSIATAKSKGIKIDK